MKLPLFYLFIIIFLFTSELFAQPWMSLIPKEKADNPGFYEQQKAFNEYWKDKEVTRSKGWKQFKRWEAFMEPRVFPDGNFDNTALFREFNKLNTRTTKGINSSNWEQLGPVDVPINQLSYPSKGIGRLNCVAFHPSNSNIIWVGAPAGGIWVSNDGGSSWSTQSDLFTNLGISDIEFNPLDPDVIYVATGDGDGSNTYSYGILKTEDAGASWDAVFPLSIASGNTIRRILVNTSDPDIVLAATSAGIYVSVNAGITWYNKQSGNFKDMEFNPNSPNVVYASSYDYYGDAGVYKSTDGGLSWTQLTNGLPLSGVGRIELAVTEANSSMVYALCANTDNGFYGLYRSYNSGGSWSLASSSPNILGHAEDGSEAGGQAYYDLALEVSSTNENILYSGGVNIWKSTNAGSSWSLNAHWYGGGGAEFVHADQHFFAIHPISGDLYSCNDGGLHITSDGGNNWIDLSDGMEITQFYRIACAETSSSIIMGGTQDNGSIKYTGGNWYKILGGDGMECMIDYNNSNVLYGTFYYGSIQRSSNGGNSFDDITPYDAGDGAWVTPFVMDPENSNTIYGGFKEVYKTTNGGSSWNAISSNLTNGELLHSLAVAPSSSSVIYAATYDKIWKTSDGGLNWSEISDGLPSVSISYIAVDDNDPQKLWLSFSGYLSNRKLYYSEDGGVNWINWSNGIPNIPANCVVHEYGSNDAVYVGTDLGVFYRSADMSEFMDYNEGLPNVIVNDLEIHYGSGKLRAGTFGRGLWQCDLYVIPQAPEADFQANLTQIYEGDNVEFTDQSTNSPTEWQWSFSGGTPNSSTDQNPNVTYSSPGIYPVSLTASNDGGSSTITKEDYIEVLINPQQLNADFEANTTTIQEGETVKFTDLS
ncbi:MAG: glycosyl hydrolase, partial [Marinilabiliales bacterium]